MDELYNLIEQKIKASGYPRPINGADVYNDICDQIDGKENGAYVLLSKFDTDVIFEYHITILDDQFNLGLPREYTKPISTPDLSSISENPRRLRPPSLSPPQFPKARGDWFLARRQPVVRGRCCLLRQHLKSL